MRLRLSGFESALVCVAPCWCKEKGVAHEAPPKPVLMNLAQLGRIMQSVRAVLPSIHVPPRVGSTRRRIGLPDTCRSLTAEHHGSGGSPDQRSAPQVAVVRTGEGQEPGERMNRHDRSDEGHPVIGLSDGGAGYAPHQAVRVQRHEQGGGLEVVPLVPEQAARPTRGRAADAAHSTMTTAGRQPQAAVSCCGLYNFGEASRACPRVLGGTSWKMWVGFGEIWKKFDNRYVRRNSGENRPNIGQMGTVLVCLYVAGAVARTHTHTHTTARRNRGAMGVHSKTDTPPSFQSFCS